MIPPHASIADIYVSPVLNISYISEAGRLTFEDAGFAWGIHEFSRHDDSQALSNALENTSGHLAANYIAWMKDVFKKYNYNNPKPATICVIGEGVVSFLPFSLSALDGDAGFLIDIACVHYAPSLYALYTIQKRLEGYSDKKSIGFIGSSEQSNLPSTKLESHFIQKYFTEKNFNHVSSDKLDIENIRDTLAESNHWHIAAHGKFNWTASQTSSIEFGEKDMPLTYLSLLQAKWFLRLVVLSSCESGLHNFLTADGEIEGLPLKFMEIGSCGVVGALWEQPDFSAALIMDRFYYFYMEQSLPPVMALRAAQLWLRSLTKGELSSYLWSQVEGNRIQTNSVDEILGELVDFPPEEMPFSNPIYWGGFVFWGQ